jgi:SAM-dependent methyltransferase
MKEWFSRLTAASISDFYLKNGVWVKKVGDTQFYNENFGLQWNTFSSQQLDSRNATTHSNDRLFGCSGWSPAALSGKYVLEIGSGAGRFTEILLKYGARVVSIEPSTAVFANRTNNESCNLVLIKTRLEECPVKYQSFDYVLCYGVVQHTPSPESTYLECVKFCKPEGACAFDHYQSLFWPSPWHHPKYFWRPISTRLNPEILLKIIRGYIPYYFNVDTAFLQIPKIGRLLRGIIPIPCWNYTGSLDVVQTKENLVEWAIMDTFDALGAKYDIPWSINKLSLFASTLPVRSYHVGLGGNGLILNTYGNTI